MSLPVTQCSLIPQASERGTALGPRGPRWEDGGRLSHTHLALLGLGTRFWKARPHPNPHHVVARQQLLQELGLLVHDRLDDELIIAGDVEDGAAGTRVRQLDEWLVAQRVLEGRGGRC